MDNKNLDASFEKVIAEIKDLIVGINKEAEKFLKENNYEAVKKVISNAEKVQLILSNIESARLDLGDLLKDQTLLKKNVITGGKKLKKELKKELKTPQKEYKRPILEALVELGGRAKLKDVLDLVYEKMKDRFTPYDLSLYPVSGQVFWKFNAQQCRFRLVGEGLLKKDSPNGVWEITDKGREELSKLKS